jgi:hypothetical protein
VTGGGFAAEGPMSEILMPRALYGDRETVRREWTKVARRAWKAGSWDDVVQRDDMASLSDLDGYILLQRGFFNSGRLQKQVHWRPYWVTKSLQLIRKPLESEEEREDASKWFLSGMKHLWFAIGMLCYEDGDVPMPWTGTADGRWISYGDFELLKGFVRWMPEIADPADRYASETFTPDQIAPRWPYRFIYQFTRHTSRCGWKLEIPPPNELNDIIDTEFDGDIFEWLIARGIVERNGARFRLCKSEPLPTE